MFQTTNRSTIIFLASHVLALASHEINVHPMTPSDWVGGPHPTVGLRQRPLRHWDRLKGNTSGRWGRKSQEVRADTMELCASFLSKSWGNPDSSGLICIESDVYAIYRNMQDEYIWNIHRISAMQHDHDHGIWGLYQGSKFLVSCLDVTAII